MLNIYSKYAPNANPANTDYPNGSGKDESVSGANNGTPLEMDWYNDMLGYSEALLGEGRLSPSGDADTALVSDRLDGFRLAALRVQTACDYTGGDISLVDVIHVGLDVETVDYVIDRNSLTRWSVGNATGTVTADDLNTTTGALSGVSGVLVNIAALPDTILNTNKSIAITMTTADKTLTAVENTYGRLVLTGTIGADRELIVSSAERNITVVNNTDDGFQVKVVVTALGNGVHVPIGESYDLRCDGVSVLTRSGCKDYILPASIYSTSGPYSYPNGKLQGDYETIALTPVNAGVLFPTVTINKDSIEFNTVGWEISTVPNSAIDVVMRPASTSTFNIETSGLYKARGIVGIIKEGVTY